MTHLRVMLHTIQDVQRFVHIVNEFPYDVDLISGRYVVDAKSIMGIFSLNLDEVIDVRIHSQDCQDLLTKLETFRAAELAN